LEMRDRIASDVELWDVDDVRRQFVLRGVLIPGRNAAHLEFPCWTVWVDISICSRLQNQKPSAHTKLGANPGW
jgi:hypothetical protein